MIIWIIGLSGAGKTTLANLIKNKFDEINKKNVILDGDEVRAHFNHDLSHSLSDRKKNAQRIINFCKLLEKQDINVIVPILHNFIDQRKANKKEFKNYFEIYIEAKKKTLFKRDHKKIYSNFKNNRIKNVVGLDLKFYPPQNPNIVLKSEKNKFSNLNKVLKLINYKNHYFYDDRDYKKNKTMYAYSNVSDKNFLDDYFSKRYQLLKKFPHKRKKIKFIKNKNEFKWNIINNYCSTFEKKKILENQNSKEMDLNEYIKISYLFSRYLMRNRSLKILNCFLKLNDYISFRLKKAKKNIKFKNLFLESIVYEIKVIRSICNEYKIKV